MFPCIPFPPLSRIKRFTRFSLNSESRHFQFRFSLLSLAPSFSPPRESRMDSPLLNFVRERSLHPIPLFSSDRGLDRTKGTETGYEGNQRAWRKEREREGERIHQQEPPRGVGVVCHWQTFIPQLRSEQSFAVRYAQPRFSFSFFFPFFVSREQRRQ